MRTIVVGAGLSGLLASLHLARGGAHVTLIDRAVPGGRARSAQVSGATLNLGPHAVYTGGALQQTLDALGLGLGGGTPSGGVAVRDGELTPLPSGAFDALVGSWSRGQRVRTLTTLASLSRAPSGLSFGAWLDQRALGGSARELLMLLARTATYAGDVERVDASWVCAQVALALRGVRYLDGGWQAMIDALVEATHAAGVQLRGQTEVREVRDDADGVGVQLDGETLRADAAVLAVPARAEARLRAWEPPALEPVRVAALDLVLSSLPVPERALALGVDAPRYVSVHTRWARLATDDRAVVHAAAYLRRDETVSRDTLEGLMDTVQPGWRDVLLHARFAPSLTVTDDLPSVGRARLDVTIGPRLARCGDHVGQVGMLADAAAASAKEAASRLLAATVRGAA